jgi:predicted RNA binding protein YcfA (HicA-like mRNA interferase family)
LVQPETSTRKVIARLKADGWRSKGGAKHEIFAHADHPEVLIPVPRHRDLTPFTARSISKAAGWKEK